VASLLLLLLASSVSRFFWHAEQLHSPLHEGHFQFFMRKHSIRGKLYFDCKQEAQYFLAHLGLTDFSFPPFTGVCDDWQKATLPRCRANLHWWQVDFCPSFVNTTWLNAIVAGEMES
jgi:hypothetical protein